MIYKDLIHNLKNTIHANNNMITNDSDIVILYLRLGDFLVDFLESNNIGRNKLFLSVLGNLKEELTTIQLYNLTSIYNLYELAMDHKRLENIKKLIQQISLKNKILVIHKSNSLDDKITAIKNFVTGHWHIDKYAKQYYQHQLDIRQNKEKNFREMIRLLDIFEQNISIGF